ncbi:MAG TPA: ABC transporter substrate-binding protein [Stellaceae bacterium]|jgi:branched-chain amino acid transport system substrate-binding protein|nr:ABC transporter substrate-binding protein [Stellaceae bacterium]
MPKPRISRRAILAGTSATAIAAAIPIGRAAAALPPLKVGIVHPTSGYLALIGQTCNRGAAVAAALLESWGYPKLDIIYGDSESSPDISRAAGNRLIDAGAQILVGAFDSGQTTTLAQAAEQHGIPLVIDIAAAPQITAQGYKFVFRNFPRAPDIVGGGFEVQKQIFATSGKVPDKCVCLHRNDTYGNAIKHALDAMLPKFNLPYKMTEYIAYDPQARDLSVEVAKAKSTGAELVLAVSNLNDAVLLTREMVKQRWLPWGVVSAGPGWYEPGYRKTLGKIGNYPISTVPWRDPTKERTKQLVAVVDKKYPGEIVDTNIAYTVEALLIVADAYKRAGSAAPQALADALRHTDIPAKDTITVGNPKGIFFDAHGQVNGIPMAGIQNLDELPKVVLPVGSAEAKLVFPQPAWQGRA